MNYTEQHIKNLIDAIVPGLNKFPTQLKKQNVTGADLLMAGREKDDEGKPIVRAQVYSITQHVPIHIDHDKNIRELIQKAKTGDKVVEELAKYQVKYSYKPQNLK